MGGHRPHYLLRAGPELTNWSAAPSFGPLFFPLGAGTSGLCCYGSVGGLRKGFCVGDLAAETFGRLSFTLWSSLLSALAPLATISMVLSGISTKKERFSLGIGALGLTCRQMAMLHRATTLSAPLPPFVLEKTPQSLFRKIVMAFFWLLRGPAGSWLDLLLSVRSLVKTQDPGIKPLCFSSWFFFG